MSNLTGILTVGAELLHEDRRTDMTKVKVAFRNTAGDEFIREWAKVLHN
jgi:hypothetical protein